MFNHSSPRPASRSWIAILLLAPFAQSAAAADSSCTSSFTRPFVCELVLRVSNDGRDWRNLKSVDTLRVAENKDLYVDVIGIAQDGREFPSERMLIGYEPDRNFDRAFEIEDQGHARFKIHASSERGGGTLRFWMPGNYNLERELQLEVGRETSSARPSAQGAPRADASFVADALYKAILGRSADDDGKRIAMRKIQDGEMEQLARGMLRSDEYRMKRSALPPETILADFYRGLLGREVDDGGRATYMPKMKLRKYDDVLFTIINSREFQKRMMER